MRKHIVLTLILVLLSAGAITVIATAVNADKDTVTHTEEVIYGNSSVAKGVRVTSQSHLHNNLIWNSVYTVGGDTETEFSFHNIKKYSDGKPHFSAMIIHSGINFGFDINKPAEKQTGLAKLYKELYDSLDYEEEGSLTVRLADCYEFYPIDVNVNLPDVFFSAGIGDFEDDSFFISTIEGQQAKSIYDKICEFIKIPVLEDEYLDINVKKHRGGTVGFGHGYSDKGSDYYSFSTQSTYTDKVCYFTINNKTEQGEIMDFSNIPGGYGVYALPYGNFAIHANDLSMVYKLDESVTVNYMTVNKEQTKLLLSVVENNITYLEIIDLTTMTQLQRIAVSNGQSHIIYPEDGFIVYEFEDTIAVVEEKNGEYTLKLAAEKFDSSVFKEQPFYFKSGAAFDFDGEHLVMVDNVWFEDGWYDKCGFFIAVYGEDGMLYYGKYENSLDTNAQAAYHYKFNCQPMNNFEVEW